jgi:hypothetical protein
MNPQFLNRSGLLVPGERRIYRFDWIDNADVTGPAAVAILEYSVSFGPLATRLNHTTADRIVIRLGKKTLDVPVYDHVDWFNREPADG